MNIIPREAKRRFYASAAGTFFVALCCFTPILAVTLGVAGLSAFTPYLDYVLFPALAIMIFITFLAYQKMDKKTYACSVCKLKYKDNEWAKKCEAWCRAHQSCNLEIIERSIKEP